jgi:hypothetical protein
MLRLALHWLIRGGQVHYSKRCKIICFLQNIPPVGLLKDHLMSYIVIGAYHTVWSLFYHSAICSLILCYSAQIVVTLFSACMPVFTYISALDTLCALIMLLCTDCCGIKRINGLLLCTMNAWPIIIMLISACPIVTYISALDTICAIIMIIITLYRLLSYHWAY